MFNSKRPACRQAGQTLIELIVVIAMGVIIIGALTFATISTLRNAQFAKNQAQATKLAQEGVERLRLARDRNRSVTIAGSSVTGWGDIWDYHFFDNCGANGFDCYFIFFSGASPAGCSSPSDGCINYLGTFNAVPQNGEAISNTIFTRVITITDSSVNFAVEKIVTVIVTWSDFAGVHRSKIATVLRKL